MDKRQALIDAATELTHRNGFSRTTLAMVAEKAVVPLGNVYYYFRTKQALAAAIADRRRGDLDALLEQCERAAGPRVQLNALLRTMRSSAADIAKHGCPFGRVSQELADEGIDAKALPLARMTEWCGARLRELGLGAAEARDSGLHLVASLQGAALIAKVSADARLFRREVATLERLVASL